MRLIKKVLRSALLAAVIAWFADPDHGAERRAKAREVAAEAARRARDGIRQVQAKQAARTAAGRNGSQPGQASPDASAYH